MPGVVSRNGRKRVWPAVGASNTYFAVDPIRLGTALFLAPYTPRRRVPTREALQYRAAINLAVDADLLGRGVEIMAVLMRRFSSKAGRRRPTRCSQTLPFVCGKSRSTEHRHMGRSRRWQARRQWSASGRTGHSRASDALHPNEQCRAVYCQSAFHRGDAVSRPRAH